MCSLYLKVAERDSWCKEQLLYALRIACYGSEHESAKVPSVALVRQVVAPMLIVCRLSFSDGASYSASM
jgi:hypothetical protein